MWYFLSCLLDQWKDLLIDHIKINIIIFSLHHQDSYFFSLSEIVKCIPKKEDILTVKRGKKTPIYSQREVAYLKRMRKCVTFLRRLGPEMQAPNHRLCTCTPSQPTLVSPNLRNGYFQRKYFFVDLQFLSEMKFISVWKSLWG